MATEIRQDRQVTLSGGVGESGVCDKGSTWWTSGWATWTTVMTSTCNAGMMCCTNGGQIGFCGTGPGTGHDTVCLDQFRMLKPCKDIQIQISELLLKQKNKNQLTFSLSAPPMRCSPIYQRHSRKTHPRFHGQTVQQSVSSGHVTLKPK